MLAFFLLYDLVMEWLVKYAVKNFHIFRSIGESAVIGTTCYLWYWKHNR